MFQAKRAVVFDWDGTLLDSTEAIVNSLFEVIRSQVAEVQRDDLPGYVGMNLRDIFADFLPPAAIEEAVRQYATLMSDRILTATLFPGVAEMLTELAKRKVRVGVFTNRGRTSFEAIAGRLGVSLLFDTTVCMEDVLRRKPDPEGLFYAMRQMDVTASETVYIGDSRLDWMVGSAAEVQTKMAGWNPQVSGKAEWLRSGALLNQTREVVDLFDNFVLRGGLR